ncbi:MAG: DUF222 domain-containing protein, partial [Acidimicrobiales bacterium]
MEALDRLTAAIDTLAGTEWSHVDDVGLGEVLVHLHRCRGGLAAVEAAATAAFDGRRAWSVDGSKSAAAWLARRCNTAAGATRGQVRLARRLRWMPHTAAALAAGEVDVHHVRLLATVAESSPVCHSAFAAAEEELVGYAQSLPFAKFVQVVRYWQQVVDPDGVELDAAAHHANRRLHLSRLPDDGWRLDGLLDPVSGAIVADELSRIEQQLFQDDWAKAKAEHGDDTRPEHLWRTPAQRRADALVEMATRSRSTPAGATRPRPLFSVFVGYETFAGRICELANGTVVTPGQIAPFLTDADIERVVFDGPSRVIDIGGRTRFFRSATRRAVEVRDRHCTHPGCDTPADQCDVDHIIDYDNGGPTIQTNGRLKCPKHHRHRHRHQVDDDEPP